MKLLLAILLAVLLATPAEAKQRKHHPNPCAVWCIPSSGGGPPTRLR